MSGGMAFVLDLWGRFADGSNGLCNREMVGLEPLDARDDVALVRRLLRRHVEWTGSPTAHRVLTHWTGYQARFVKVMPHDLRRALETEREAAGERAV
jgi:glutamate synthase domain-containing protein 3